MLYILLAIFVILFFVCVWKESKGAAGFFGFAFIVALVICGITFACYNSTESTCEARLHVLEEQNETVLASIQPIIEKYAEYETTTIKNSKCEKAIAIASMYPDLKANEFFMAQIAIIVENQKEIKELKLERASLNAYHLWLFTPKTN